MHEPVTLTPSGRWTATALPTAWLLGMGLLWFALVWLAQLSLGSLSPPTDSIEQLTWVQALQGGYYKHPPLPTWLLWWPVRLLGARELTTALAGAACTLGSLALMWRLLRPLRGERFATIALLAALCITYYNGRLNYYNHNTVLMVFVTASAALCWQACRTGLMRWWLGLGLALGLGALAKYQIVVAALCVLAFWWQQGGWRSPAQRRGLVAAALLAALVFTPHAVWLVHHDFAPLHYAAETSLGVHLGWQQRWLTAPLWLVDQLFNRALPAWLLLALAVTLWRKAAAPMPTAMPTSDGPARHTPGPASDNAARHFLLIWGGLPLVFMAAIGLLFGVDLQMHWGTAFLLFTVPAVMELASGRIDWPGLPMRPVLLVFIALQVLLLAQSQASSATGLARFRGKHWRTFNSAALARAIDAPARTALGGRICVVSGPAAVAGVLALRLKDHPRVLIDGRYDRSPWVDSSEVGRCGMLALRAGPPKAGWVAAGPAFPEWSWRAVQPGESIDPDEGESGTSLGKLD